MYCSSCCALHASELRSDMVIPQSTLPEPPPPTLPSPMVEQFRQTLSHPVFAAVLAGGVAGAVSRTVVSPLERLKILFQIQSAGREEYKMSVGKGLAKMWREEGWRGFMRGNGTNCIRIVPYSAVQFGSYSFYKRVSTIFQPCGRIRHNPHFYTLQSSQAAWKRRWDREVDVY